MAFDREALQRKLNTLSGNTKKRSQNWRPNTDGEEHVVRLLSFPDNDGQPFKELWFYYNIGNNPGLLTPNQFGDSDPIQELITNLREDGSKESYELAKKLYPKNFIPCWFLVMTHVLLKSHPVNLNWNRTLGPYRKGSHFSKTIDTITLSKHTSHIYTLLD